MQVWFHGLEGHRLRDHLLADRSKSTAVVFFQFSITGLRSLGNESIARSVADMFGILVTRVMDHLSAWAIPGWLLVFCDGYEFDTD